MNGFLSGEYSIWLVLILVSTGTGFVSCIAYSPRQYPLWGAANTPYKRWLPPEYEDTHGAPRGWDPERIYHNYTLPPVGPLITHYTV